MRFDRLAGIDGQHVVPMVGRKCSIDRNSCRSSALKAQKSTT